MTPDRTMPALSIALLIHDRNAKTMRGKMSAVASIATAS
jgi:hypothetical protein